MEGPMEPRGKRGSWIPRTDFIFSCLTWTFSEGYIWRLPSVIAANGGVVFLIPFACGIFFLGYPLMYLELSMGQFASSGIITIWECCPILKGIGYAAVIMLLLSQVNIYAAWSLHYLVTTCIAKERFPWTTCDNMWNTITCYETKYDPDVNITQVAPADAVRAADEYFSRALLQMHRSTGVDDPGVIRYEMFIALGVVWVFVFFTLIVGHYSMGKVAYVTTILPSIFVLVLAVRGATLPGSVEGLKYTFYPNFDLGVMGIISRTKDALITVIYEFGLMCGVFTMLGSYNKRTYNFYRDSSIVTSLTVLFALLSVVMVGGFMGYSAFIDGQSVDHVMASGHQLVFMAMPTILATLDGARVWLCVYFLTIFFLAFGTQMLATESVVTALADEFFPRSLSNPRRIVLRSLLAFLVCAIFFGLGVPYVTSGGIYVLHLMDNFASTWTPIFLCLFACIAVTWIYGVATYSFDIETLLGYKPNYVILGNLMVLAPLFVLFTLVAKFLNYTTGVTYVSDALGEYIYPEWAVAVGWLVSAASFIMLPLWAIIHILRVTLCNKNHSGLSLRRRVFGSSEEWVRRKEYYLSSLGSDSEPTSSGDSPNDKGHYPGMKESRT